MVTYNVTTELKTSLWLKLLRFLRIKSKRTDFEIVMSKDWYTKNEIVSSGDGYNIKVLGINFAKTNIKRKN